MKYIVLESIAGSPYRDTISRYEFPPRYLPFFPEYPGQEVFALIYEPRGERNRGRMAYVGWALIDQPPFRSSERGADLFEVIYKDRIHSFRRPVPNEVEGAPFESWLAALPRGRMRSSAKIGRAVREISSSDLEQILFRAEPEISTRLFNPSNARAAEETDRTFGLIEEIKRDSWFRSSVLAAYSYRCAVTGISAAEVGDVLATEAIVEPTHIRPVSLFHMGPQSLDNGIVLVPSLHNLFTAGLITFAYADSKLTLHVSARLPSDVMSTLRPTSGIPISHGTKVVIPPDHRAHPSQAHLRYHQRRIFRG